MNKFSVVMLLFTAFLLSSCKTKNIDDSSKQISFAELYSGSHSNVSEKKMLVVNSKEALKSVFEQINQTRNPSQSIPKVDFDKSLVVVLFMGSQTTGGHGIFVTKILEKSETYDVYYFEKHPNGPATSVMTQPFHVVKFPKTDKKIEFIKESKINE